MEKKISYLNRTYADYKEALIEMSEKYYPDLTNSFSDASIAAWQIDVAADVADNLSYHIDRVFQETNIDSAQERSSLYAIARNNGVKIPGPKGSMAEVRISVVLDNLELGPIIRRGTRFSSGSQEFELLSDVDFNEQFNENGISDRTIIPIVNTNGIRTGYNVSKLAIVTAGETRVYRHTINTSDVKPFMEVLLPIENIMNIESILVIKGSDSMSVPSYGLFYSNGCENGDIVRFYEVDNLIQNECWSDASEDGSSIISKTTYYSDNDADSGVPLCVITKGEWKPVTHKFITEYTDKGYLKVIFGSGNGESALLSSVTDFNKWQMSRILNNDNLGVLPEPNSTMFILYRVGGGTASNVAKGAINRISYLNADFRNGSNVEDIMKTLTVSNTTPSISGKDMPSEKEIKYYIKYHKSAQNRCVTIKDYIDRILMLPPKYGTPFRVGVAEENNKIVVYLLGIDSNGKLTDTLPTLLKENISKYLQGYRMINDYIEIKPGRIINLQFNVDAIVDKNYNKSDVVRTIINTVQKYMDINSHLMGEEIYIGDLEKEISKIDGVVNLISLEVINKVGGDYSNIRVSQPSTTDSDELVIDLEASDWILYNDGDTMMEIKKPEEDIKVRIKER
jgi:hypothetical protein